MSRKKFAIVLSGCGVFDGAEIHEATLSMYAISKNNADYSIFAPDINQHHVVNHLTGQPTNETRNVLVESARIARGKISDLKELNMAEFDAILFPGGFGAAKNLCDFAFKGADCSVLPEVEKVVKDAVKFQKPIGALCIAPALIARILGDVEVTIGQDEGTASAISAFGAKHTKTMHGEVAVDRKYKVVTTPCYMLDSTIAQIGQGAENVVKTILEII